ncbi:MAG: 4Fe-4S binding protein [Oscillospiraceae bacterium]|nr:4Fe-4S binding protein [Oscillospiraceae bacterium]
MDTSYYLKMLVEDMHSATVATLGGGETEQRGYFVGPDCIGCKLCYSVRPQKCIDIAQKPVVIDQNRCLRCGRCAEICPKRTIEKRG